MKTVMQHDFSKVPHADIPRSTFDRSHGHKTTFDAGLLIPFLVDEALPGDTFKSSTTLFARLATPIFPIMDNMYMDTQFFAIPMRLVWENWEKFNGEQDNPGDSTDFLIPQQTTRAGGEAIGSLSDHLGIPPLVEGLAHSTLWHRAYNLTYNQWYKDQNLIDNLPVPMDDGPDDPSLYKLNRRGKRHDYFTAGLPWPQKSDSGSVSIPLGDKAPVLGIGPSDQNWIASGGLEIYESGATGTRTYGNVKNLDEAASLTRMNEDPDNPGFPEIYADLQNASAATINQLRQSFQVQKMFERDARGGTRYTEVIKSHFGVTSPDSRLQRVEYLGGGSGPISFTPVSNTVGDPSSHSQGDQAAYAIHVSHDHGFTKSFTEHCLILGIVSVRADLTYQRGLPRMFSRNTRFDFYWPALSHIGEQEIKNKELFAQGSADLVADDTVFAYQERFAEYRYKPSEITGNFRSVDPLTLDAWHLSQDFANLPTLGQSFIEENPPVDRVIAIPGQVQFIFDSYTKMHCARPMPIYGVPGLIDHF